ncbi:MAG: PHP domain-containing protein, partial [Streptosporangiaceae bacterium]
MGWDNPPVPWREFERRLSWRRDAGIDEPAGAGESGESGGATAIGASGRAGAGGDGGSRAAPRAETALRETTPWAELHCHSSYSFLDGASAPEELIVEAAERGLTAIAITDHDGMYGVPQFAQAAARFAGREAAAGRAPALKTVFGAELSLDLGRGATRTGVPDPAGRHLLVLARDPEGYRRLCQVISAAHLAGGQKGRPVYDLDELARAHGGHWAVLTGCRKGAVRAALDRPALDQVVLDRPVLDRPARDPLSAAAAELRALTEMFGGENVFVELITAGQPDDDERNDALVELAARRNLGVVGTNNVHYATPADARLAQALAAIRA